MNTEGFTGKAQAYAAARPGYPDEAVDYICSFSLSNAVFADMGAGTGKFTELIARRNYKVYAIEPNADMREQLSIALAPFRNARIIGNTAESTDIPRHSVDVIVCSQSLGWFDLDVFRAEIQRIGKPNSMIVSLFNEVPGSVHSLKSHKYTSRQASDIFFVNPAIREFPNPVYYTRERWLQRSASNSNNPKPGEPGYEEYVKEENAVFDHNSIDGLLRVDLMTVVYSERIKGLSF